MLHGRVFVMNILLSADFQESLMSESLSFRTKMPMASANPYKSKLTTEMNYKLHPSTLKSLNFWMPENFALIYLKFKKRGKTFG